MSQQKATKLQQFLPDNRLSAIEVLIDEEMTMQDLIDVKQFGSIDIFLNSCLFIHLYSYMSQFLVF